MPLPEWLESLTSSGLIASFIHTETVDISTTDHDLSLNDGYAYALHVGGAGDIKVEKPDGSTQLYKNVQPGLQPFFCTKIIKAGTTASDIVAGAW